VVHPVPHQVQQRNSSGAWRTLQELTDFTIVQSYLDSAAKWGLDKLKALRQLFTTGAWCFCRAELTGRLGRESPAKTRMATYSPHIAE
jgi:transposase